MPTLPVESQGPFPSPATAILRRVLIPVVLSGLLLLATFLPVERYLVLVGAVTLVGMALVLAQRLLRAPVSGLSLLLVTAVLVPLESKSGATSFNATVPLAAGLCALWLLQPVITREQRPRGGGRAATAAAVFMIVAVFSFVVGQVPWFPTSPAPMRAQLGGLALFLLSGGLFLGVSRVITSPGQLQRLTWLFIWLGGLAVALDLILPVDIRTGSVSVTSAGSIGSAFWTWLVALGAAQAAWNRDLSVGKRLGVIAVVALALVRGLFLAFSWVSGWLPPLIALGMVLLFRFPRTVFLAALLLVGPAFLVGRPAFDALMAGESYSLTTRLEAVTVMLQLIERSPWFGLGPANYYYYTELFPLLGWHVKFNSHNNYLDLLAQTGVVGLIAFGWFVAEMFRLNLRLSARLPAGFAKAYAVGVLGGLIGSLASGCLADWIVPFAYNIGLRGFRSSLLFWFFLGGAVALNRLLPDAVLTRERPNPSTRRRLAVAAV